jgi:hypothetical protein
VHAVVVVPMLPGRACSPNGGWGWRARAAARAELRECARLAAMGSLNANNGPLRHFVGHEGTITLDAEIRWCCGRKRMDDDNCKAALKGAIDGLSDALWGGEDKHVRMGEVRQSRGDGSVTFLLWLEGS